MDEEQLNDLEAFHAHLIDHTQLPILDTWVFGVAQEGYQRAGRGVVLLDVGNMRDGQVPSYYLSQESMPAVLNWPAPQIETTLQSYDPQREVIVIVLRGRRGVKLYRIQLLERDATVQHTA